MQPLIVSKTQYSVADFLSWQRSGQLELRPKFQRGSVWNKKAKSFLIDSLVKGFPIPVIFLQTETDPRTLRATRRVVDGQQRLRTVLGYVDPGCLDDFDNERDDFTIMKIHNADLAQKSFSALPQEVKNRILETQFSIHQLPGDTPNSQLLEIFSRLNSSGVRLNAQELRNAKYHGAFKHLSYTLAFEATDKFLEWEVFNWQNVAQMFEVEMVSDLLVFMLRGLEGKKQTMLDTIYEEYDDEVPHEDVLGKRFRKTMEILDDFYSGKPELKSYRTQAWFYAVFVATYNASFGRSLSVGKIQRLSPQKIRKKLVQLDKKIQSGDVPAELQKALRGASSDKASRENRVKYLQPAFRV